MLRWIDIFSRVAFCSPPPEEEDDVNREDQPKMHRALTVVALVFGAIDLVDAILDTIEAIRQTISGNRLQGATLLIGMVLARLVARTGHIVLEKRNGLSWVAFFQDPDDFMARFEVPQQKMIRSMFALLFTELSIFMFEDVVLLAIWIDYNEFETDDVFNQLNAWVTFLSAVVGTVILIGSVVISLVYWTWKKSFCGVLFQIWKTILFLVIFGIVAMFLFSSLVVGFQIITATRPEEDDNIDGPLFVSMVALSWILSMFFSCRLSLQSKKARPYMIPRRRKNHDTTTTNDGPQHIYDDDDPPQATEIIVEESTTITGDDDGSYPFAVAIPIDRDSNIANHV